MRYGINLPPFEDFADAAALADLARDAEAAGWDGFFLWDHVVFDPPQVDVVELEWQRHRQPVHARRDFERRAGCGNFREGKNERGNRAT